MKSNEFNTKIMQTVHAAQAHFDQTVDAAYADGHADQPALTTDQKRTLWLRILQSALMNQAIDDELRTISEDDTWPQSGLN